MGVQPNKRVQGRIEKAKELSNQGLNQREVAKEMRISSSTAWKYLNYKAWLEKEKVRREKLKEEPKGKKSEEAKRHEEANVEENPLFPRILRDWLREYTPLVDCEKLTVEGDKAFCEFYEGAEVDPYVDCHRHAMLLMKHYERTHPQEAEASIDRSPEPTLKAEPMKLKIPVMVNMVFLLLGFSVWLGSLFTWLWATPALESYGIIGMIPLESRMVGWIVASLVTVVFVGMRQRLYNGGIDFWLKLKGF